MLRLNARSQISHVLTLLFIFHFRELQCAFFFPIIEYGFFFFLVCCFYVCKLKLWKQQDVASLQFVRKCIYLISKHQFRSEVWVLPLQLYILASISLFFRFIYWDSTFQCNLISLSWTWKKEEFVDLRLTELNVKCTISICSLPFVGSFLFQNHFKHTEVNEIQNYCGSNRLLFFSRREKLSHIDSSTVNRVFGQTESVITVSFSNELCLMTCGWALNHFCCHQKWNGAHFEWQRIASLFAFKMTKLKTKITKPNQAHTKYWSRLKIKY